MNLSELIRTHKGARSYRELERDCGGEPSDKRLQQLVTQGIKNFPDPSTVRALATGLKVSERAVVLAAAESLGIDVGASGPRLMELLGTSADALSEEQAGALAAMVKTFVATNFDELLDQVVTHADFTPTQKTVPAKKAARTGRPNPKRQRIIDEQDRAGEENQDLEE